MAQDLKHKDFSWNDENKWQIKIIAGRTGENMDVETRESIIAKTLLYKGDAVHPSMIRFLPEKTQQMVLDEIALQREVILETIKQNAADDAQKRKDKKDKDEKDREDKLKQEKEDKQTVFFPAFSEFEGYQMSGNALFTDLKNKFLEGRTLHLRAWSENLEYSENTQATYKVKVGYRTIDGILNICADGKSYKDSLLLNKFPEGEGFVEMELEDSNKKKYKVKMDLEII